MLVVNNLKEIGEYLQNFDDYCSRNNIHYFKEHTFEAYPFPVSQHGIRHLMDLVGAYQFYYLNSCKVQQWNLIQPEDIVGALPELEIEKVIYEVPDIFEIMGNKYDLILNETVEIKNDIVLPLDWYPTDIIKEVTNAFIGLYGKYIEQGFNTRSPLDGHFVNINHIYYWKTEDNFKKVNNREDFDRWVNYLNHYQYKFEPRKNKNPHDITEKIKFNGNRNSFEFENFPSTVKLYYEGPYGLPDDVQYYIFKVYLNSDGYIVLKYD